MRTIRVEVVAPFDPPPAPIWKHQARGGELRISTEVIISGDGYDEARDAGKEAADAVSAFIDGYSAGDPPKK